jgi:Helix-turn-helix
MARPPRPENANNPLRQLRALLKDPAKEAYISQHDLALLCEIPVDTIKSIEVGRLALNPIVLRKIAEATGASWDHEEARWTRFDKTEFTFSFFSDYRQHRLKRPLIHNLLVDVIHSRINWLFENVPEESWAILRSRLTYFLEECKRDLKLTSNDALFYSPTWLAANKNPIAPKLGKPEQQKHQQRPKNGRPRKGVAGNKK